MSNVEERVVDIYIGSLEVYNTINEVTKLNKEYFENNWSIGISSLTYDIQQMSRAMLEQGFSLDYKQANTFMSYLKIYEYILKKISDELVMYEEGIASVEFTLKNLERASKPFFAHLCSRIRDLGLLNKIPGQLQTMYHAFEEDIDKYKDEDMSLLFELAYLDEDDKDNDEYLESLRAQVGDLFGSGYDLEDFESISSIVGNYMKNTEEEISIELDF